MWQDLKISKEKREERNGHQGAVFWLTGFSGAGKSTIAKALEKKLFESKYQTILLDGDNVRHGLCGDLGFSDKDRTENIRRVAEVANLFFETGNLCICTFISPFKKDRDFARTLVPEDKFFEVFIKCNIEVCKERDPKGLYKKALAGEIKDFTGISSAYEVPKNPEVILETDKYSVDELVEKLFEIIKIKLSL